MGAADEKIQQIFGDEAPASGPTPRLQGDDLYIWAKLVSELEHAQRALNGFGPGALKRAGHSPQEYAITNDGYIVRGNERGPATDS